MLLGVFFLGTLFSKHNSGYQFAEGLVYTFLVALFSSASAVLAHYQHHLNRAQVYVYLQAELSPAQRQLILLSTTTYLYLCLVSFIYTYIEGWDFDDALYWVVSTVTTIGFGDIVPKTTVGKACLSVFASCGIVIIASYIFSIRNVMLEMITFSLANQFSVSFNNPTKTTNSSADQSAVQQPPRSTTLDSPTNGSIYYQGIGSIIGSNSPLTFPYQLVPESSKNDGFIHHHHTDYEALDLASDSGSSLLGGSAFRKSKSQPSLRMQSNHSGRTFTPITITTTAAENRSGTGGRAMSPLVLPDPKLPVVHHQNQHPKHASLSSTINIRRSSMLPQLFIETSSDSSRFEQKKIIVEVTRNTFHRQMAYAALAVVLNMLIFGGLFSIIEGWAYWEGVYFSYISLTTIGFGDYRIQRELSRSLFIWHVFFGIASITYLSSMVAERAMNQWIVQVEKIERRVDRYETKASLKKMYKKPPSGGASSSSLQNQQQKHQQQLQRASSSRQHHPPLRVSSSDEESSGEEDAAAMFHLPPTLALVSASSSSTAASSLLIPTMTTKPRPVARRSTSARLSKQGGSSVSFHQGVVRIEAPYAMSMPSSWNFNRFVSGGESRATRSGSAGVTAGRGDQEGFSSSSSDGEDEEDLEEGEEQEVAMDRKGKQKLGASPPLAPNPVVLGWSLAAASSAVVIEDEEALPLISQRKQPYGGV